MPLLLGMLHRVTPLSKVQMSQHLGTVEPILHPACKAVTGISSRWHCTRANALLAEFPGCHLFYRTFNFDWSRLVVVTGGLMNWRVWYLGLVWLLMESALFGIIFW